MSECTVGMFSGWVVATEEETSKMLYLECSFMW
jgi:hypothetical protein